MACGAARPIAFNTFATRLMHHIFGTGERHSLSQHYCVLFSAVFFCWLDWTNIILVILVICRQFDETEYWYIHIHSHSQMHTLAPCVVAYLGRVTLASLKIKKSKNNHKRKEVVFEKLWKCTSEVNTRPSAIFTLLNTPPVTWQKCSCFLRL